MHNLQPCYGWKTTILAAVQRCAFCYENIFVLSKLFRKEVSRKFTWFGKLNWDVQNCKNSFQAKMVFGSCLKIRYFLQFNSFLGVKILDFNLKNYSVRSRESKTKIRYSKTISLDWQCRNIQWNWNKRDQW